MEKLGEICVYSKILEKYLEDKFPKELAKSIAGYVFCFDVFYEEDVSFTEFGLDEIEKQEIEEAGMSVPSERWDLFRINLFTPLDDLDVEQILDFDVFDMDEKDLVELVKWFEKNGLFEFDREDLKDLADNPYSRLYPYFNEILSSEIEEYCEEEGDDKCYEEAEERALEFVTDLFFDELYNIKDFMIISLDTSFINIEKLKDILNNELKKIFLQLPREDTENFFFYSDLTVYEEVYSDEVLRAFANGELKKEGDKIIVEYHSSHRTF